MYLYNINLKSKPNDKKGMRKTRYFHITVCNLTLGSKVKVTGKKITMISEFK
jgi:hypothetical protein